MKPSWLPQFRLGTLLLLVVIAALLFAFVFETLSYRRELHDELTRLRIEQAVAHYNLQMIHARDRISTLPRVHNVLTDDCEIVDEDLLQIKHSLFFTNRELNRSEEVLSEIREALAPIYAMQQMGWRVKCNVFYDEDDVKDDGHDGRIEIEAEYLRSIHRR